VIFFGDYGITHAVYPDWSRPAGMGAEDHDATAGIIVRQGGFVNAEDQDRPWVGLRPYGTNDESKFFGRGTESRSLARLWQSHRLTLLIGDSGVGKTSLLHAGVVPLLRASGAHVLPVGDLRYRQALPAPLIPVRSPGLFSLLSSWQPSEDPARCVGLTVKEFFRKQMRKDTSGDPKPTLVAIDGAERVLRGRAPGAPPNRRFLAELVDALASRPEAHLLLSIRPDCVESAHRIAEALGEGADLARFELTPLDLDSAIEAVTKPLARGSVTFGEGVAAQLVDALLAVRPTEAAGEPGISYVEPVLLQVLCTDVWERVREGGATSSTISGAMIQDVDGVLAGFCTRTLATLTTDHNLPTCEIGTWLRRTLVSRSGEATYAPQSDRPHEINEAVARAVEDRHLIKFCLLDGVDCYQLQHPRLAGALQRLGEPSVPGRQNAPADLIREAERAMSEGNLNLAGRHAQAAIASTVTADARAQISAHLILGDIAYARAEHEAAIAAYESAISMFPPTTRSSEMGSVFAAIARLKLIQGDPGEALGQARSALVIGANETLAKLELGQAQWHANRHKQAIGELDHILGRESGHVEALRIRGEIYADAGNARSALADLDKVTVAAPPSALAARALALAGRSGSQVTDEELDELLAEAQDHGLILLTLARVMRHRNERDLAARLAADALDATNPCLAEHHRKEAEKLSRGK
jgi:tetratricopeptide (TPR) repeat protein